MHFIVKKERRPMLKNFGKYKLAAVHTETVDQKQIEEEIQRNCSAKASDVRLVLTELAEVINQHLRRVSASA